MKPLTSLPNSVYRHLLQPLSLDPDSRRQEYILNVLLLGLAALTMVAFVISTKSRLSSTIAHNPNAYTMTVIFTAFVFGLIWLSRRGHFRWSAYVFVLMLTLASIQLLTSYGFMLPTVSLACVLVIVVAGVLLGARTGLIIAAVLSIIMVAAAYGQLHGQLHPDTDWLSEPFYIGDALGYIAIFILIGLVSWLANREITYSLHRARASEQALALERDNLEIKVKERTRELEESQLIRSMELSRFAEFGQLSANLLHEVSNPLTAASLNLELLTDEHQSDLVRQVQNNLQHMTRYIIAARKQIKGDGELEKFNVRHEIDQVLHIMDGYRRAAGVEITFSQVGDFNLYGDAVHFSQLIANLVRNAVDAYDGSLVDKPATVDIAVTKSGRWLTCRVHDWGRGIPRPQQRHVFDAFYTTKHNGHSMGIGLAMVKQYCEQDFGGSISLTSSAATGTEFVAKLTNHSAKK